VRGPLSVREPPKRTPGPPETAMSASNGAARHVPAVRWENKGGTAEASLSPFGERGDLFFGPR